MDADVRAGFRDSVPFLLGIVPFAMVTGIAAIDAGLTPIQGVVMSVIVFAGTSQLAALDLLRTDANLLVVIGTAVIINLRMMMYSASIAPYLVNLAVRVRLFLAYFLTDQAYAMSLAEFAGPDARDRVSYFMGVAGTIWGVWVLSTALGVFVGVGVPPELELSFAVPLVFLALLVPAMHDRPTTAAAAIAGTIAVVAGGLPFNLGLVVGATSGVLGGLVVEEVVHQ